MMNVNALLLLHFVVSAVVTDSVTITCERKQFNEPPSEWTMSHERTPSDILDLKVQLQLSEKSQLPVLNISWIISPDGSIQELRATMICIQNGQGICLRCNYSALFKRARNPQGQPFHYAEYPVDPETWYFVNAFNIPTSNIDEFPPEKLASFFTPSCDDVIMKNHKNCEDVHWNPNISLCMVNNDVVINFTTTANSLNYDVDLVICDRFVAPILNATTIPQANMADRFVHSKIQQPANEWKSNGSRISITFVRNDVLDLSEQFCVIIKPYFPVCHHYCHSREEVLNCSKRNDYKIPNTEGRAQSIARNLSNRHPYMVFGFIVLSVILLALGAGLFVIHKLNKVKEIVVFTNDAQLLQPVKVLIVYSMDNTLFQNVVLTFAELLQRSSGIQVIIDMWQKRSIAEMGPAQWLALQKEIADKIIIICSKGAKMKWDAICHKPNIDQKMNNSENMYSTAISIFCSDLQSGSHLHKYSIVYFDKISSANDIPGIFSSCVKYCLGKDINKLYKNLHGASQKTCSKHAILMPHYDYKIPYNHKMNKAILEFKYWQNINSTSLEITVEDLESSHAKNLQTN
ncbi:interleukin-17 receptor B isoform X2 [Carcharodon carcharias]|uniref:interleukin-17 receptor B isoform X2 n=1 Tax=Carcharodon carcharias TaxID=13397 RepID=UPI001B7F1F3F|nr:interleukin-17 receptor B isoform X2 [Carcharodon carcharias]